MRVGRNHPDDTPAQEGRAPKMLLSTSELLNKPAVLERSCCRLERCLAMKLAEPVRCETSLLAEAARQVALVGKAGGQGDLGQ